MKKFLVLPLLVIAFSANAQLFDFGVMGGANFPDLKLSGGGPSISGINVDNAAGFHIGAMLRIKIIAFYVQPALLYTSNTSNFSFKSNGTVSNGTYELNSLDVPIPFGFKLGPVALFAGPVASFNLASPNQVFDESYKTTVWKYQAGVGVKLFAFMAELKYQGPFTDDASSGNVGGTQVPATARTSMWMLSVGYFFGKD